MTTSLKHYQKDWLLFAEAGFIAVNQADEDSAMKLFKAGELLNPENTLPQIGFGYLHLHKLELKQAANVFEKILAKDPGNEMATAFLGLCMGLMPNLVGKGEKMLEKPLHSDDPLIKNLAATSLEFIDKFVKKSPGPAGK